MSVSTVLRRGDPSLAHSRPRASLRIGDDFFCDGFVELVAVFLVHPDEGSVKGGRLRKDLFECEHQFRQDIANPQPAVTFSILASLLILRIGIYSVKFKV